MNFGNILAISTVFILFASLFGCAQGAQQPPMSAAPPVELENQSKLGDLIANGKPAANGDTVGVYYTGKLTDGTVFDTNVKADAQKAGLAVRDSYPLLTFTVGAGQMISGFDAAVVGMKIGEEKTVTLAPAQAYGERNAEAVLSVPLDKIGNSSGVKVGSLLYAQNGASGRVTALNSTTVTVDFNHELAGQTLVFTIKMMNITKR
ncbi:MAG: peptidylprolyl isomerase [Candidatus Micrarchaeia archaeon]